MPLFSVSSTETTPAGALVVVAVLAAPFALGCASAPVNPTLETIDPTRGYRFENTAPGENNSDELFVMVSLSSDRRSFLIRPTEEGRRLGESGRRVVEELEEVLLATLEETDLEGFDRVLEAIKTTTQVDLRKGETDE